MSNVEPRIVEAMRRHGFTATEARAYVALLKHHPATGYELAARSGIPRSAIYEVLHRLAAMGAVEAVQSKPAKYIPISPNQLFELLTARFNQHLADLRTSIAELKQAAPKLTTRTVRGYDEVMAQAQLLIEQSKHQIHASLWAREASRLAPAFQSAQARGVDVVLFSFNPIREPDVGQVFSYEIPEAELEGHWEHRIIVVVDRKSALIGGAELHDDVRAVATEDEALVEVATNNLVLDITLLGERQRVETEGAVAKLASKLAPIEDFLPAPPG
ncbi:MAG: helix-turn-helix domain-containing protein [Myxococcota bacterium]